MCSPPPRRAPRRPERSRRSSPRRARVMRCRVSSRPACTAPPLSFGALVSRCRRWPRARAQSSGARPASRLAADPGEPASAAGFAQEVGRCLRPGTNRTRWRALPRTPARCARVPTRFRCAGRASGTATRTASLPRSPSATGQVAAAVSPAQTLDIGREGLAVRQGHQVEHGLVGTGPPGQLLRGSRVDDADDQQLGLPATTASRSGSAVRRYAADAAR